MEQAPAASDAAVDGSPSCYRGPSMGQNELRPTSTQTPFSAAGVAAPQVLLLHLLPPSPHASPLLFAPAPSPLIVALHRRGCRQACRLFAAPRAGTIVHSSTHEGRLTPRDVASV